MKNIITLIVCCFLFSSLKGDIPKPFENTEAFALAETLPHSGPLKERQGYYYVKVDDRYINSIFPLFVQPGIKKPPYFRRDDSPGAHISVLYEDETKHLSPLVEIGTQFSFTIVQFATVKLNKTRTVYLITVEAPELESLRRKYGCTPLLHGHDFHITVALHDQK